MERSYIKQRDMIMPEDKHWGFTTKEPATDEALTVMNSLVPRFAKLFIQKNRKYAAVRGNDLGSKGFIPDINRKMGILRDRIWDGNPVVGESNAEVIQDLIGHLFLLWVQLEVEYDDPEEM